jgi:hypothetical protein
MGSCGRWVLRLPVVVFVVDAVLHADPGDIGVPQQNLQLIRLVEIFVFIFT